VGQPGIEPGTSVLSGLRSNRLSYWPRWKDGRTRHAAGALTAEEWWGDMTGLVTAPTDEGSEDPGMQVGRRSEDLPAWGDRSTWGWAGARCETERQSSIPRKEVIQPHLPVRLPCYDFVPIAGPTLGGCPRKG
jgi:hypothetical protein